MPHTTHAFPFESMVVEFAARLSALLSGPRRRGTFLLVLDEEGAACRVQFEEGGARWHDQTKRLDGDGTPYLFYDPFEPDEYTWLSWSGISRETMERLIGRPFVAADFVAVNTTRRQPSLAPPGEFPRAWGVMF